MGFVYKPVGFFSGDEIRKGLQGLTEKILARGFPTDKLRKIGEEAALSRMGLRISTIS